MASPRVGWGFMPCTASIASKNYKALQASSSASLVAVASRDAVRAQAWLDERGGAAAHGGAAVHGSYSSLLADARVEAVYMPLPTTAHLSWVLAAAAAGKRAVLLEKPCAVRSADLRLMVDACAAANAIFADGVMFQHHPRLRGMLAALPRLGAPRRMTAAFSFAGDSDFFARNIRVRADGDPLGCVGDLGWYCARLALLVYGGLPARARAVAHARAPGGVPTDVSFSLEWPGGAVADCHCGFTTAFRQWVEVAGDAGTLSCDDFVLPRTSGPRSAAAFRVALDSRLEDAHCRVVDAETGAHTFHDVSQEANMFDNLSAAVRARAAAAAGRAPAPADAAADADARTWPQLALDTQAIVDAVMDSLNDDGRPKDVRAA